MAQSTRFVIHNDLPDPLTLDIEPEGIFFSLGHGESGVSQRWLHVGTRNDQSDDFRPRRADPFHLAGATVRFGSRRTG